MSVDFWTYLLVGLSFSLYIGIAVWSRAGSTKEFYVAGGGVPPVANGMATAADWMSAASFISMAGIISFAGRDGSRFLMGWTGGYVLLALLLAPYLRRFGKFTVPDFIGDRYYSKVARVVAIFCAIFVSFTYVAGQMRGVGLVFGRYLGVSVEWGVVIGMCIVFFYAVLGGMRGITYTQVAQFCVLIFAYMVPAIFLSIMMTGNMVPQFGLGGDAIVDGVSTGQSVLSRLDGLSEELGFAKYTDGSLSTVDLFCITLALMAGTAGLPHVIVRFYTVKKVADARKSAFWALLFIAILYTAAPAVAVFARTNLLDTIPGKHYSETPEWFKNWEDTGLIAWVDKNEDGVIQYLGKDKDGGAAFVDKPVFSGTREDKSGPVGQRLLENELTDNANELYIDRDIMVLANPEIGGLPNWVIGLIAAGGLAAALSTAAGLLLVISSSVSHDLLKKTFMPDITEKGELKAARIASGVAVCVAGYFGIDPPDFVASVVALAFGLAASSFFPAIILGIFWKRTSSQGAIAGMVSGIAFTSFYIVYFKFMGGTKDQLWFGISPEGIGTLGMVLNFIVTTVVTLITPTPPAAVQNLVQRVRVPRSSYDDYNPDDDEPVMH